MPMPLLKSVGAKSVRKTIDFHLGLQKPSESKPLRSTNWSKLTRQLHQRYGSPRHGNLRNPLNELVYIILSAKTRIESHSKVYRNLRKKFPTWDSAYLAGPQAIQKVIEEAGLSQIKSKQIWGVLDHLKRTRGRFSIDFLRHWPNEKVESYLAELPGVGLKTARCVMLYSLDRMVFPVDTHTARFFTNMGITPKKLRLEFAQDEFQAIVPPRLRYTLHVNIVAHGRQICIPGRPKCSECICNSFCLKKCL